MEARLFAMRLDPSPRERSVPSEVTLDTGCPWGEAIRYR